MANPFQKARKEQVWVKVMLAGPSGSGKSYTGLRLATGLANECDSRVAVIDTEAGRIRYYAEEFDFDDLQLEDYTPESYIEMINAAAEAGYKVLLIDSTSHEWAYCYETVNKMPGNSFTNWGKMTPRHDRFMEAILQSPMHIICTVRGKDQYTMEEKNGKQTPKKIGLGYKQRDDTEYEYTITFNLAQDTHIATATKDNTHIFENRFEVLTERDGKELYRWANSGAAPSPKTGKTPDKSSITFDSVEEAIQTIDKKVAFLIAYNIPREEIGKVIKSASGTANYKKLTDAGILNKTVQSLNDMIKENGLEEKENEHKVEE